MSNNNLVLTTLTAALVINSGHGRECVAQTLDVPTIGGVEAFQWGTQRNTVMERQGFPASWKETDSGVEITYPVEFQGEPAELTFFFARERGLVRARYVFRLDQVARCEEVFEEITDVVSQRYRNIVPQIRRTDQISLDPCELAAGGEDLPAVSGKTPTAVIGGSNRSILWQDPNSTARIELTLSGVAIHLLFEESREVGRSGSR